MSSQRRRAVHYPGRYHKVPRVFVIFIDMILSESFITVVVVEDNYSGMADTCELWNATEVHKAPTISLASNPRVRSWYWKTYALLPVLARISVSPQQMETFWKYFPLTLHVITITNTYSLILVLSLKIYTGRRIMKVKSRGQPVRSWHAPRILLLQKYWRQSESVRDLYTWHEQLNNNKSAFYLS